MKKIILLLISLFSISLSAQSDSEKIAELACQTLQDVIPSSTFNDSIKAHIINAKIKLEIFGSFTVEGIRKEFNENYISLIEKCPKVRTNLIQQKAKIFYGQSPKKEANDLYKKGSEYLKNSEYKQATKFYKKAIKVDPEMVTALDDLAVCYRKLDKFDKAKEYYSKSLTIFPEGSFALLNLATIHNLEQNYELALKNYELLFFFHPKNPEGYFGLAVNHTSNREFKKALKYICVAINLYPKNEKNKIRDCEIVLSLIHKEMKKLNLEKEFDIITQQNNVEFRPQE